MSSIVFHALRLTVNCVNGEPVPVDKQQDRWGSRWISLDLTLPTVFHPPGPPLPICMSLQRKRSRMQAFMCGLGEGSYMYRYKYQAENARWLWARRVFAAIYTFTLACTNTCLLPICLSCKAKWQCLATSTLMELTHIWLSSCSHWIFSLSGFSKQLSVMLSGYTKLVINSKWLKDKIRNGYIAETWAQKKKKKRGKLFYQTSCMWWGFCWKACLCVNLSAVALRCWHSLF